jgi:energy-coupling factor transporter ATPase
MPLIRLEAASFRYPEAPRPALNAVSLSIEAGEYVAVVGPNGSGKSTLLRLLDGLLRPSSGSVLVDGLDASDPSRRREVRGTVGLVFQSPADQIVSTSVEEDVAFGPENLGLPREEIARRVGAALEAVGLGAEKRRPTHFLSAGQQQRLAVAGALAMGVRCIAFDEATSMLDPEGRRAVLALIDGLVSEGTTVVHVTHDMNEAARARRLIALEGGAVAYDGTPAEFFGRGVGPREDLRRRLGLPDAFLAAQAAGLEPLAGEDAAALAARLEPLFAARLSGPFGGRRRSEAPRGGALEGDPRGEAFQLEGVSHSYLRGTMNETVALRDLDLTVPRGIVLALVGRTGSGKSTALQLLDGLAAPFEGRVLSLGVDLGSKGADLRSVRTRAPLAVQRPEAALFERYAGDDVAFGPRNLGLSGRALVERVSAAMEEAGLKYAEFRDRRTRSLSGGEKRELALAGILAMEGEALLLDEPTSALDPAARQSVRAIIGRQRAKGRTIVMATHSMEEAARADLVAVFREGRLAALGDPERIFYDDYDPAWGIGRPFAAELASRLEERGAALGSRPLDLEALASVLAPLEEARP